MPFLRGTELVERFVSIIKEYPEFTITQKGNPLRLKFNGKSFMIFFKCISYAGKPYPENTTRAQLPCHDEFDHLDKSDIFFFLGYDIKNDLYVCWDPKKTRNRLNQKSYVSFFSRKSLQESVQEGEFKIGTLTNGDKFLLFKRSDLCSFFEMYELHFSMKEETPIIIPCDAPEDTTEILEDVENDYSIKLLIDEMITSGVTSKLEIISACMNTYGTDYKKMRFIDWSRLIGAYMLKKEHDGA